MYKYEYETVSCEFGGWGFGSGNIYGIEDYRSLINKRAAAGWRYVGLTLVENRTNWHSLLLSSRLKSGNRPSLRYW